MTGTIKIVEEAPSALPEYGQVPISYYVKPRFNVKPIENGLGGWRIEEQSVACPYLKDYDDEGGPQRWLRRWDTANWALLSAYEGAERVGGTVLAWRTPELHMLEGRDDLTVMWNIRVRPEYRRQGIGASLFGAAAEWARSRGCKCLKIETQDVNVPACRFYPRQGCELRGIYPGAYAELSDEVMRLWYLDL